MEEVGVAWTHDFLFEILQNICKKN